MLILNQYDFCSLADYAQCSPAVKGFEPVIHGGQASGAGLGDGVSPQKTQKAVELSDSTGDFF